MAADPTNQTSFFRTWHQTFMQRHPQYTLHRDWSHLLPPTPRAHGSSASGGGSRTPSRSFYPWNLQEMFLGGVLGVGSSLLINVHDRRVVEPAGRPRQGIARLVHSLQLRYPRAAPPITLGFVSGLVPVFEEVAFNGVLRNILRENQLDPSSPTAIVARAVTNASLFSLCHVEFTKGLKFNLRVCKSAFVAGIVFTSLAEFTDNLWGSTVAHSLVNIITFRRINRLT